MPVIDFHSHILPGIDDGSRSREMTDQMLTAAESQGVEIMVATPHFYADSMTIPDFLKNRTFSYQHSEEVRGHHNIRIIQGSETAFFSGMSNAADLDKLKIDGTDLLMVEMPFRAWSEKDLREIEFLIRRGIIPVIAHLERFYQFQKDKELIPALIDMPVYIQINAEVLLKWTTRGTPIKLFRNGEAQLLGSDCHNTSNRCPNLGQGREVLRKKLGQDCLDMIDMIGIELLEGRRR